MNNKLIIILVLSLFLGGLITTNVTTPFVESKDFSVADGEASPIYINHNDNFTMYKDSGSGTAGDPYIISGDNLESFGDACIYIINTDVYAIFDNMFLNGAGYYGIYLENVSNVNITNSVITEKGAGILIENCSRVLVYNVDVYNRELNDYGIEINLSDNIDVANCYIEDAAYGLVLLNSFRLAILNNEFIGCGISFDGTCQISIGVLLADNIANGKPIGYLYNNHDASYNIAAYGQAILVSCINITLYNADISDVSVGVQFIFCQNCIIQNSLIYNNEIGILVYESSYCRILRNNITSNNDGVKGYFAVGTIVAENNIISNVNIGLWASHGCSSSAIYLNNFIDNGMNARDDGGIENSNLIWASIKFINPISEWPLDNVSVTIQQYDRSYTGYSNEMGIFKVPLPNLGPYNVTMEKFRYETINIINYDEIQEGINLYDIGLTKANLGAGTGYVLARFMDGVTPIVDVSVKVYSYLDEAYYFHSEYTSASGTYAGWVTITGLYYDNYTFVITHPNYERNAIQQIIISNGWAGTYDNIQLTHNPTDAFIYGNIYDFTIESAIVNVNITVINEIGQHASFFTDSNGFFNITNIPFGSYSVEISKEGYQTEYLGFTINSGGNQLCNPVTIYLTPEDYVPENPLGAVVNNWNNQIAGNYWDDFGGIVVLASEEVYVIPGNNMGNPVDEYPLDAPYIEPKIVWSDILNVYESMTPDDRIDINSLGIVKWKVCWASNRTEIITGLTMMIRVNGSGVDELLLAEYIDGWWTVNYNHTEVSILEFSVYSVYAYGMVDFEQSVDNIKIIWDNLVIIITTPVITITTVTNIIDSAYIFWALEIIIITGVVIVIGVYVLYYRRR